MQNARQVFWGIVTALVSFALILGALFLSVSEGNLHIPSSTLITTVSSTSSTSGIQESTTPIVITPTPLHITQSATSESTTPTTTITPSLTQTVPVPTAISCTHPAGWLTYIVQPGDTLSGLAIRYKRTILEISQVNCLDVNGLQSGMIIFLPPLPTRTPILCGSHRGWLIYYVQKGDTLYRLSQTFGVTVAMLQRANCITGTLIRVGEPLFVPPGGALFPSPTFDPSLDVPIPSDTPTDIFFSTDTPGPDFTPDTSTPTGS
jgi:LysM repeat protein